MKEVNRVRIGTQLREAREASGLTQGELAERADVHRTYISQLERDLKSPTIDVFFQIAKAMKCSPSRLMAEIEKSATGI